MAFIPIDAKADVQGSKKGKLTPAQHAQLNAWCLASKTGILDCLDKCVATASSYIVSNNKANIIFKKGYIVICGRLVECEAGTVVEVTTPTTGSVTGKIILKYDLSASQEGEFIVTTKTGSLVQQDLNEDPVTGIYEFELYSYTATPTNITLTRTGDYVPDIGGKIDKLLESLIQGTSTVKNAEVAKIALYASGDMSKGSIEQRLTKLGFKQGSISATNISNATLKRQGNYVIGNFVVSGSFSFVLPENFRPKEEVKSSVGNYHYDSYNRVFRGGGGEITFNTDGTVSCSINGDWSGTANVSFGYEASPIK